QPAALDQRDADVCGDLSRLHNSPLGLREPRISSNVVHNDRLATPVCVAQRRSKGSSGSLSDKGPDTVDVLSANDVLATIDFRIADTVRAQVFPKEPCSDFLHIERIAQRSKRVGEPEKKCFSLLGASAFRDIQIESGEPHYVPIAVAVGLAPAFYPSDRPVATYDAEGILPFIPLCTAQDFIQDAQHTGPVLLVDTARPSLSGCRFSGSEAVQLAKTIIPINATCKGIPCPGATTGSLKSETEPVFAFL